MNYITPKFLELADNLTGITDPDQLFYMLKFRLMLVSVNLSPGQTKLNTYGQTMPVKKQQCPTQEQRAIEERKNRLRRLEHMDGKEWKFTCHLRYKCNCPFFVMYY